MRPCIKFDKFNDIMRLAVSSCVWERLIADASVVITHIEVHQGINVHVRCVYLCSKRGPGLQCNTKVMLVHIFYLVLELIHLRFVFYTYIYALVQCIHNVDICHDLHQCNGSLLSCLTRLVEFWHTNPCICITIQNAQQQAQYIGMTKSCLTYVVL